MIRLIVLTLKISAKRNPESFSCFMRELLDRLMSEICDCQKWLNDDESEKPAVRTSHKILKINFLRVAIKTFLMWQKWNNHKCYWRSLRLKFLTRLTEQLLLTAVISTLTKKAVEWRTDDSLTWVSCFTFLRTIFSTKTRRKQRFNLPDANFFRLQIF